MKATLILKGKTHPDINKVLKYYRQTFNQIILSTWSNKDIGIIDKDKIKYFDNIILSERPKRKTNFGDKFRRIDSLLYQTYNVLKGLDVAENELIVIIRSDEYYHNLHLFEEKYKLDTDKLITNNIYFKPKDVCALHPSDHLLCGKKDNLLKCYNKIFNLFTVKNDDDTEYVSFENIIAHAYIKGFDEIITDSNHIYLREKYLDFIDVEDLRDYKVCNNTTNRIYINNFNPNLNAHYQLSVTK